MSRLLPVVALLVDIENIKISIPLETAIIKIFPTVEMIKIAVGNWKLLDLDRELLARGYHLVHVPTGHNSADLEIINLSWLIKDFSELVIVSNDKIFRNTAHQFHAQNKMIHFVYHCPSTSNFIITKSQILLIEEPEALRIKLDSQLIVDSKKALTTSSTTKQLPFDSPDRFAQALKKLITKNPSIKTEAALASEFHKKFGIKASKAVTACQISGTFNQFISDNKILAGLDKRKSLIAKITDLVQQYPELAGDSSGLGNKFKQLYGISISEQMKQAGISGKSSKLMNEIKLAK
jgi:hypothetical protein